MELTPPDVLLLNPEWPERALLRAELIEDGLDAIAVDAWPIPGEYRQAGRQPRAIVVDLHGLPDPRHVLDELRLVIPPDRVLVIAALGTMPAAEIRQLGYRVLTRPIAVRDIVSAVTGMLA